MTRHAATRGHRIPHRLATGVLLALALTGCAGTESGAGQSSPSGSTGESTSEATETMNTPSMRPSPGLEPLGQEPTRDELLTLLERTTAAFTQNVAGPWDKPNGEPYEGADLSESRFMGHPARTCASVHDEPEDKPDKGYNFGYRLEGPGVDDPDEALDQARAWARANGWHEANTGPGGGSDESGSVFIHFTGAGLPSVTFDASTEITRFSIQTPCSAHPTVLQHHDDRANDPRYDPTAPHDRFSDPEDFPGPASSTTG